MASSMFGVCLLAVLIALVPVDGAPRPSQLEAGGKLTAGQRLWSPNGQVYLEMQTDGNAVLYNKCGPFSEPEGTWESSSKDSAWATYTNDEQYSDDLPSAIIMEADGNLAIYNSANETLWSSKTADSRFAGAVLKVGDDGSLCISKDGTCVWKSYGIDLCGLTPAPEFANSQVIFRKDQQEPTGTEYSFLNGTCKISRSRALFRSHNMIVTRSCDGAEVFSLTESGQARNVLRILVERLLLQDDAYLDKMKATGADLRINSQCRLCIYKDGSCRWSSSALTYPCPPTESANANVNVAASQSSPAQSLGTDAHI